MGRRKAGSGRRRQHWRLFALWPVLMLAGCHIVSIEHDRADRERRSGSFDATTYVSHQWARSIKPTLERRAVPYATFANVLATGLTAAEQSYGYRAGEGSAWTFVTAIDGVVTTVDRSSRQGVLTIAPAGMPHGGPSIEMQIGPVITGTTLRDAVPAMQFDDFSGQVAYAEVGEAVTRRAMAGVSPAIVKIRPGAHVRLVGAFELRHADDPILLTPLRLEEAGGGA